MMEDEKSVERLISRIRGLNVESRATFELWVPEPLTLNRKFIEHDVALALIVDEVLNRGFEPDGFVEREGGRTYKFRLLANFGE